MQIYISSNNLLSKSKPLWDDANKNRIYQPVQLESSQFPLQCFKLMFVNLFSIAPNGTK